MLFPQYKCLNYICRPTDVQLVFCLGSLKPEALALSRSLSLSLSLALSLSRSLSLSLSLLLTKQFCQLAVARRICASFWRLGRGGRVVLTGSTCCLVELAEREKREGGKKEWNTKRREWLQKEKRDQQHRTTSFCLITCEGESVQMIELH